MKHNTIKKEIAHAIYKYIVIAEENNRGRHAILETRNPWEAAQLEKEINAGIFAGCLMNAAIEKTFVKFEYTTC